MKFSKMKMQRNDSQENEENSLKEQLMRLYLSSLQDLKFQSVSCSLMTNSLGPHGRGSHQAPLSMNFSRQEYWSGLPSPPPGNLPDPGIKPMSLVIPALTGGFFTTEPAGKPNVVLDNFYLCLPKNPL